MYLFDTDTLSNIVRPRPSRLLIDKLRNLPKAVQFTTAINVGEIYFGAYRSAKRDVLIRVFEEAVFPNVNILPFDNESGKNFGFLKSELEKDGIGCSEPDMRIAAIAIQQHLTLVTGNTKHFKQIPGLKIENWVSG